MSLTVLFDLDNTLLQTNLVEFLPGYFGSLGQALSHLASPEKMIQQLRYAVAQMTANQDPGRLLSQIFAENFYGPLGTTQADCLEDLTSFYLQEFPKLRGITQLKPKASELVKWCQSKGMTMAIATNPLFPTTATRQRIEWAGLNPDDFAFYSTFDNFHFTKPNLTYFAEALDRLGWPTNPAVMIGDDLTLDLLPMETMGFATFWINPEGKNFDRPYGSLTDVKPWLEQINQKRKTTYVDDPEVSLAVLRSSPAVIDTWLKQMPAEILCHKPSNQERSIVEILWHLAEIEKEIYKPQWEQLLSNPSDAIVPINTRSWDKARAYQARNPGEAFESFLENRRSSLSMIETLCDKGFFEVSIEITGFSTAKIADLVAFSAKHDQLHLRQCGNLFNIYKIY